MLRALGQLKRYHLAALDGEFGKVVDVLFDDEHWTVRYLVVKTGPWLFGRKVLIGSQLLEAPDRNTQTIRTRLTKGQIKDAPELDSDAPVSRQREREFLEYSALTPYWQPTLPPAIPVDETANTHLRSMRAVTGYRVAADDEDLGEVVDFIVDDDVWVIRFIVVCVGRAHHGRTVLIAPEWVNDIDWRTSRVALPLDRERVEHAPEYRPELS